MATIREFANEVAKMVENAEVKEVAKANGVIKTGLVVGEGAVRPTVYIDDMYENGYTVQQAAAMVTRLAEEYKPKEAFNVDKFLDFEGFVKANLRARLYNKKTEAEVKRSAASRGFKDLIIVPYVELEEFNGTRGSIKVKKEHIEKWGVSAKEVIDIALENTAKDTVTKDLFGFMLDYNPELANEMLGGLNIPDGPFIVSNKETVCGASAILGLLPELKKKYANGFFVLPSSIHEVLVLPNNGNENLESLNQMVKEVNASTVSPEEVLADQAYAFGV